MDVEGDTLRANIEELERAHNVLKGRLTFINPDVDPYEVTDQYGRPILINALANLVFARAVLRLVPHS